MSVPTICSLIHKIFYNNNINRIHDSVGKVLRTADQGHVTVNSHALSSSFHPGVRLQQTEDGCFI
jgi:hypothetical protein